MDSGETLQLTQLSEKPQPALYLKLCSVYYIATTVHICCLIHAHVDYAGHGVCVVNDYIVLVVNLHHVHVNNDFADTVSAYSMTVR